MHERCPITKIQTNDTSKHAWSKVQIISKAFNALWQFKIIRHFCKKILKEVTLSVDWFYTILMENDYENSYAIWVEQTYQGWI